jgi:predicted DNA-binding transcriptional regulator YafY
MSGKIGMHSRRQSMERSFGIRAIFESNREVTVRMIAEEFGITKQSAQKWIDVASLYLPIYEKRKEYVRGAAWRKVYGLLK